MKKSDFELNDQLKDNINTHLKILFRWMKYSENSGTIFTDHGIICHFACFRF